ncbi:acyl-CoA dehydrogenase family protein [Kineococcus gypseus]|uniref:acyl-CoA dehydrogenase family protein n=1 Tax=Kineococcus gypseus TaxID=1637102 RepID=UPI003D7E6796
MDTDVLRAVLDGRFADVRERARREFPADLFGPIDHLGTAEQRALTTARLRVLADLGGHELGFSPRHGGGGSPGGHVAQFEVLGFGDASLMIKSGVQWGLFGGAVQALGTERHHAELLPPLLRLDLVGCFAMTESGHGSDVASLGTTATYDPAAREFVVHTPDESCRKDYIGGAARDADVAVVFAQLVTGGERRGVHAFVVPLRGPDGADAPGVRRDDDGRKAGLNGVDNGRLWFDSVRVPRTALLDRYAQVAEDGTYSSPIASANARFFTVLGALVKGRVSVSGGAISQTKVALEIAARYALRRTQFARPTTGREPGARDRRGEEVVLMDYLAHQRRLLVPLAGTYALSFAQQELVDEMDDLLRVQLAGGDPDPARQRAFEAHAAGLKVATTWHATRTIQTCREACGGAGYLSDSRLPQLKADTDVFTTFEGDNTVLLQLVAKSQLTAYAQQFSDLDTLGTVRFATRGFVSALAGRSPARSLVADVVEAGRAPDDLHDRGWQLRMLAERERHVVESLARRVRKARSRPDQEAFEAVDGLQDHLLLAGRAHVDRVVAEAFAAAIARTEDPAVAALLGEVLDLHALALLEAEKGWYLEHRRMTTLRAKALTRAVNEQCRRLRPRTEELLAGLGIPRHWLASSLVPGSTAPGTTSPGATA